MTTINRQVSANDDDAHEDDGGGSFSRSLTIITGNSNSASSLRYNAGHRFTNVTVPQGASIIAATVQVQCTTDSADDANVDIHAEDVDDAVDFLATGDVTSRARTAASVAWVATGLGSSSFVTSPELKTVIQEIVNRAGWVSGNAIVVILAGKDDVARTFQTEAHDAQPTLAAKLDITYSVDKVRSYARAIL